MDPTCGLADKFRDLVVDLIWEQLRSLVCYGQNIEELNERLKELTFKKISIQHQIDGATSNAENIEDGVLNWMHEVDEIAEQVEKLHRKSQAKLTECSLTSCPNPWLRYKLSKRAKALAQQVLKICGKGNFNAVSYRVPPQSTLELTNDESNEGIVSRVRIRNQVKEALRDPGVNMIGLCGLPGVGKTTIAKDVGKEEENQDMFKKVIMVTVSQELNIQNIQDNIAEKLGMQLDEKNEDVRASRLRKRLNNEKNMLLILDDLWEKLDLAKVGIPIIEGSKILLTSRDETLLLDLMKCQKIIKVGVLLNNEAWELFQRNAELSIDSIDHELRSVATMIVQKCGGLPLAIATAARALRNKDLNAYKDALSRLNNPLRRNNTLTKDVDIILKWSYDRLSSTEYQRMFLLAAMLSHDPSIEALLMYSVGLDILKHVENMEEANAGVSTIVRKLKSLNLFLDSYDYHSFTMHDVTRDVALGIASDELHAFIRRHTSLTEWPDENELERYKGIFLLESDIVCDFPEELHGPGLEFFLLNSKRYDLTIPRKFFESSKELKVLSFTHVRFPTLPSLSSLQKLKTLCLHSCLLGDISEVKSLERLKVLSLAHSEIQQLPVELAGLVALQMLNLSECPLLKVIPPKVISSLRKLEVLNMTSSFTKWKVDGSNEPNENASLDELKDLPISSLDICIPNVSMLPPDLFLEMNLERYKILIGKSWKWWDINDETSKTLKFELEHSIHLKRGVRKLMEGVEDLDLCGSSGDGNVLDCHDGSGFPYLRHLRIESNNDIKYIVLNSSHREVVFPMLESLKLHHLKALEKLCQEPNGDPCVKVLLPKLEVLELSYLNHFIPSIWDDLLSQNSFSNLKTLKVVGCGFMKLVPLHVLLSLNSLEELEVEDCDKLEMVFDFEDLNDDKETEPSSVVVVPLQKIVLRNLPKLKHVWNNYCQGNVSFPSLWRVDVSDCESLTCIFPAASIAKGMFHDLEELRIIQCGMDAIIAKDQVSEITFEFPCLTLLKLIGLPNLKNFYSHRHSLKWPLLQKLCIECCDGLEIFKREPSSSSEIREEENTSTSKYPLVSDDCKVIPSLEELRLKGKQVKRMIGGSGHILLHRFPNLQLLSLSLEEKQFMDFYLLKLKRSPDSRELVLTGDFEGPLVATLAAPFSKLTLSHISTMESLSSSFVSLSNLTHLRVHSSIDSTILMTSSSARCLIHITHLLISSCIKMEEIIAKHEGEEDGIKEIVFNKLQFLELEFLQSLKRFCGHNYTFRFPVLNQLTIRECLKFNTFSPGFIDTPSLKSVQLSQYDMRVYHEIFDIDLNKTFFRKRFVATKKVGLDGDDVSIFRNGLFPEGCFPEVEILHIKRVADEGLPFPHSLLERFPELNELHVEDSSFEEIFPSHSHIVHQIPPFKRLYLDNLVQLKNIWRDDSEMPPIQNLQILHVRNCCNLMKLAPSSTSFHNLIELKVSRCHQLVYLLTNSTAKSLVNLGTLKIDNCEKMEGIVKKEIDEDVEEGITFNVLRTLKLARLPKLKTQDEDNVEDRATNIGCKYVFKSLFGHDKVIPSLEELELRLKGKQVKRMIGGSGHILLHRFPNLQLLSLSLEEEQFIDPYLLFLKRSPDSRELVLIGEFEELLVANLAAPFSKLTLFNIYTMGSLPSSFVPLSNLTHLRVQSSNHLTILMTSSTARSLIHITHLLISSCNQMEEIITKHEGEEDGIKEIVFNKLQFLELQDLQSLKRFCGHNYTFKFPVLSQLTITVCPKFKTFSLGLIDTPSLNSVQLSHDFSRKYHEILDTDLDKTFYRQRFVESREMVLDLYDVSMIMNDQFPADSCPQVEILGIEGFVEEGLTFPYALLQRFPQLTQLHVDHCSFAKILPSHVPPSSSTSFHNLTKLKVSKCHQLVYLLTNSTAKNLVNLETLEIDDCKKLEEIVRKETDEDADGEIAFNGMKTQDEDKMVFNIEDRVSNTRCSNISRSLFGHNTVLLPKLEVLKLSNLLNNQVSLILDDQLSPNSFSNLKTLIVESCDSMKVIPLHVLKSLNNLEKLEVISCDKLEMVFGFEDVNVPLNLTHLEVQRCHGLTTLVTSSIAQSLVHLTHLSVCDCNQIDEIITKQEGEDKEDKEIFFSKLMFLELYQLPRLKRFCGYDYSFKFPLLERVTISECPQLTMFCPGTLDAPLLQSIQVTKYGSHKDIWLANLNDTIQHQYTFEEVTSTTWSMALNAKNIIVIKDVFPLVGNLYIESFQDEGTTFPYNSLARFPKLYSLYVEHCSFEEIFPSQISQIVDFKRLFISYLDELKSIWKDDSQLPPIHQNLRYLEVKSCCNLLKLAPSSASFHHLEELSVSGCDQLIHLVTASTARSLVSLKTLEINDCNKMEQIIVLNETNEDVQAPITFNKLWRIKLTHMPSLKMFSSQSYAFQFPKLKQIEITGCPQMKKFCGRGLETPKSCKVKIEEQDMEWNDGGDLNTTIQMPSSPKV